MKPKSLGMMIYPSISIEEVNNGQDYFILKIDSGDKVVRIKSFISGVRCMTDKAKEVVERKRSAVLSDWNTYLSLKKYTGYVPPNGED